MYNAEVLRGLRTVIHFVDPLTSRFPDEHKGQKGSKSYKKTVVPYL
jgi:hypothetical protein